MIKAKIIRRTLFVLAIIAIFVFNVPIPIHLDVNAIELRVKNFDYFEDRTVQINGWYSLNLFTENRFRGEIVISGHNITHSEMLDLRFVNRRGVFSGIIEYYKDSGNDRNRPQRHLFGVIHSRVFFRDAIIVLYEDYVTEYGNNIRISDPLTSPIVVLNAETSEDAKAILQILNIRR